MTHDYDGTMAKEKVHVIVEEYIPLFVEFREIAEKFCWRQRIGREMAGDFSERKGHEGNGRDNSCGG